MSAGPEGKAERMKAKNPKRLLWRPFGGQNVSGLLLLFMSSSQWAPSVQSTEVLSKQMVTIKKK